MHSMHRRHCWLHSCTRCTHMHLSLSPLRSLTLPAPRLRVTCTSLMAGHDDARRHPHPPAVCRAAVQTPGPAMPSLDAPLQRLWRASVKVALETAFMHMSSRPKLERARAMRDARAMLARRVQLGRAHGLICTSTADVEAAATVGGAPFWYSAILDCGWEARHSLISGSKRSMFSGAST